MTSLRRTLTLAMAMAVTVALVLVAPASAAPRSVVTERHGDEALVF